MHPTFLLPGPYVDYKHALKIFDPVERSRKRSEYTDGFCSAVASQCNPSTIVLGSVRPSLAEELNILDAGYAREYGLDTLPQGHGNLQGLFPPDLPLPAHRLTIRADAIAASGRPTPPWPPTIFAKEHVNPPSQISVSDNMVVAAPIDVAAPPPPAESDNRATSGLTQQSIAEPTRRVSFSLPYDSIGKDGVLRPSSPPPSVKPRDALL
jgi:hypothetical protein